MRDEEAIQAHEDRRIESLKALIAGESVCSVVAVELGALTHWWGFVHERGAWVQFCTGLHTGDGKPIRGHIRDCPTLPLCCFCVTAAQILEDA